MNKVYKFLPADDSGIQALEEVTLQELYCSETASGFEICSWAHGHEPVIKWHLRGRSALTGQEFAQAILIAAEILRPTHGAQAKQEQTPTLVYGNDCGIYKQYQVGRSRLNLQTHSYNKLFCPENIFWDDFGYWLNLAESVNNNKIPLGMRFLPQPSLDDILESFKPTCTVATFLSYFKGFVVGVHEGLVAIRALETSTYHYASRNNVNKWPVLVHLSAFDHLPKRCEIVKFYDLLVMTRTLYEHDDIGQHIKPYHIQTGTVWGLVDRYRAAKKIEEERRRPNKIEQYLIKTS